MCQVLTRMRSEAHKAQLILGSPGTEVVHESGGHSRHDGAHNDPNLKYDRSKRIPIILHPQPSDDPNDPLVCQNLPTPSTPAIK